MTIPCKIKVNKENTDPHIVPQALHQSVVLVCQKSRLEGLRHLRELNQVAVSHGLG